MTQNDWQWPRMTYQGSWGHQGVQGGARGHQGAPRGSRVPPAPKRVIKQQNNGPKPWFKVPKVCPDPKGMVLNHFWGIWGHLGALKQQYLVKMPICQKPGFGKIYLEYNCSGPLEQKNILFGFFQQYTGTKYCWKNPKYMIFCSRWLEQLYSRLVILFKKMGYFFSKIRKKLKKIKKIILKIINISPSTYSLMYVLKKKISFFRNIF